MSLKIYQGMNFGPQLGPVTAPSSTGFSGKLVKKWVKVATPVGVQSNPLEPGLGPVTWIYGWMNEEDDDPGFGRGGEGGGTGGGGGAAGGGGPRTPPKTDPYVPYPGAGPKWDKPYIETPTGRTTAYPCSDEDKKRVLAAYQTIMSDSAWKRHLSQYYGLLECIANTWNYGDITIDCEKRINADIAFRRKNVTLPMNASDPVLLVHLLVEQLVYCCGGTILDASAIAQAKIEKNTDGSLRIVPGLDTALFPEYLGGSPNRDGTFNGKWVQWNPALGLVWNIDYPDSTIIPGAGYGNDKKTRETIELWRDLWRR